MEEYLQMQEEIETEFRRSQFVVQVISASHVDHAEHDVYAMVHTVSAADCNWDFGTIDGLAELLCIGARQRVAQMLLFPRTPLRLAALGLCTLLLLEARHLRHILPCQFPN